MAVERRDLETCSPQPNKPGSIELITIFQLAKESSDFEDFRKKYLDAIW
ncbi:MAG: hypothetical protein ACTSW1_17830 [Candidatus Hodarchaeales archaeon]